MYIYKHLYRIWLRKLHSLKWIVHFHLVLMVTRQQKNSKAMKRGVKYFYKFLKQNTFSLAIRVMQQNFFDKIQTSIFKGVQSPQILSSLNCAISLNWAPVFKHIFFRTSTSHLNLDYKYCPPSTVQFPLTEHPFFFQNDHIPLKSRLRIPLSYTSEQNDTRI